MTDPKKKCPFCGGSGQTVEHDLVGPFYLETCASCKGTGEYIEPPPSIGGGYRTYES